MRIYAIRHGQSEANLHRIHGGWAQVPLTEKGHAQAAAASQRISGLHFDEIIVSDLLRARQTAEQVFPGRSYRQDPRIREIHLGSLEGKSMAACKKQLGEPYLAHRKIWDFTAYGGENLQQMQNRVSAFLDDLTRAPENAQIAVVCHEGTILCMLRHVMGYGLPYLSAFADNCSISVFTYRDRHWVLNKWNETGNVIPEA